MIAYATRKSIILIKKIIHFLKNEVISDAYRFMIKMTILHNIKTVFSRFMPYFHILIHLLIGIVNNGYILTD